MINSVNKVEVYLNKRPIGRLAITSDNLCAFEYNKAFLLDGFSISPFYLPLQSGVFVSKREPFNGLFGVFNDCLPDGWGMLLTDRTLKKHQISLSDVSLLDRLCLVANNGVGALSFQPSWNLIDSEAGFDLNQIANEVENVLHSSHEGDVELLYKQGGSSGGARPKVFYKADGKDWIVKFRASEDPLNMGEMEYEYALAAQQSGIEMPPVKLFEGKYFGTERFDIKGGEKTHVHSMSGLLNASFRYPSLDYADMMKATLALTKDRNEVLKMYRQMVFNVLTYNRDDHAKNFSFLCEDGRWKLSPAYDLVLSKGFNGQHTSTILGKGLPEGNDLLELAKAVGLPLNKTQQIFDEVSEGTKSLLRNLKNNKLI